MSLVDPIVVKLLVLALCVAASVIVGLAAGILSAVNGTRPAGAVLAGGAAATVAMPVALSVAGALGGF
jgi:ABC-type dipeptide/oligopeptide/nickel transport system permease component